MPSSTQAHARSHALLLLQKLLNLRDSASPFTLVLDTLEQSARPLIREFLSRAKVAKSKTIFVSFSTLKKPAEADVFIKARGKTPEALRTEIASHYPSGASGHAHKILLLIDTLNPLASTTPSTLPLLLSSLITPAVSLVCVYHTDVPLSLSPPPFSSLSPALNEYEPRPLPVLTHLATSVLRVSSLQVAVARQRARNRSLPEPGWGLGEGREGVLVGLKGLGGVGGGKGGLGGHEEKGVDGGLVLEMELRRRSGRAVVETFVLVPRTTTTITTTTTTPTPTPTTAGASKLEAPSRLYLLSEHPAFRAPGAGGDGDGEEGEGEVETTFSLGLTEKQRRDREGIVLPYFDAQQDGGAGAGEGGRILYEMGREDDFDDEEDEI
ncbi:histone acetylation protein 2 [Whalleya microplaca]|nr:histone acetylation protein 2 [Whalleya microplaca]